MAKPLLIVNNAELKDWWYSNPLKAVVEELTDQPVGMKGYWELPGNKSQDILRHYRGVILSGVPLEYSFNTLEKRVEYMDWVKTSPIPVLGICLGMQNLGMQDGAEIVEDAKREEGLKSLTIVQTNHPLMKDIRPGNYVYSSHRAAITLPPHYELLASTADCQTMAMALKDGNENGSPVVAVQCHPEFRDPASKELAYAGLTMLQNFVAMTRA